VALIEREKQVMNEQMWKEEGKNKGLVFIINIPKISTY
jgi:hypothetical protein